jgi:hypothetical protein
MLLWRWEKWPIHEMEVEKAKPQPTAKLPKEMANQWEPFFAVVFFGGQVRTTSYKLLLLYVVVLPERRSEENLFSERRPEA